jgi:hypothetical protein
MIKFLSLVVFLVGFIWTWSLFNSEPKISYDIHAGLQSKLTIMIEDTLKKARPNIYAFAMENLTTETLDENKISAKFRYSYMENGEEKEKTHQTVHGEAILNRTAGENAADQKWIVQNVRTDQSQIEFQEGTVIGSGPESVASPAIENTVPTSEEAPIVPVAPTEEPKKTE